MLSRMAAFASKHPNMHCSTTRGRISLQQAVSRGLLPPRRRPECARAEIVSVLHVCEVKRDRADTHTGTHTQTGVCLWIQSSSLHCLSDLSSNRQLSNLLPHTSDSRLLYPPISLMLSTDPSIFQTPSFSLNLPCLLQLVLPLLPLCPSFHLHLFLRGRQFPEFH